MANIHLTNDNGVAAFGNPKDKIGAVTTTQHGDHLVVVQQKTDWSNKEFVVTPKLEDCRFCVGYSGGIEQYPNVQGGPNVYNDTNVLITNARNLLNNGIWWYMDANNGAMPVWIVGARGKGALRNIGNQWTSDATEFGASQVMWAFDLHRIPLSKMTSFKMYVRCWAASYVFGRGDMQNGCEGLIIASGLYNGASQFRVKLYDDPPQHPAWDLAENADAFEFCNHVNNGRVVSSDTYLSDNFIEFDPFWHQKFITENQYRPVYNSYRVYSIQGHSQYQSPQNYYHDFELTNTDNLNLLKKNPSRIYAVTNFHLGNPFSNGAAGHAGMIQGGAACCFVERVELVLRCTGSKFNN